MPQFDGFALLEFLKANNPAMLPRVLVVTAALTPHDIERANEYGVCAVTAKPFDVEMLLHAVNLCAGINTNGPYDRLFSGGMILLLADMLRHRLM